MTEMGNEKLQLYVGSIGRVLKTFSLLYAQKHEAESLKKDGGIPEQDIAHTAFNRVSEKLLEEYKERLELGDDFAVVDAMSYCLTQYYDAPEWLREEFITRHAQLVSDPSLTLDDAFGPRFPKNAKRIPLSQRRNYALVIYCEVQKRYKEGQPIDEGLFESVGKFFDLEMTRVRRHYYWFYHAPDLISVSIRENLEEIMAHFDQHSLDRWVGRHTKE